jgi:hypothetical protein
MERDECDYDNPSAVHEIIIAAVLDIIYFYMLYSVASHLKKVIQNTTRNILIAQSLLLALDLILKIVTVLVVNNV